MAMKAKLSWDDVAFCREDTGLPIIIKGVLSPAQALDAERHGCAGVWLSNHGGRQLDNMPSAMTVLPQVADALKGWLPVTWMAASIAARTFVRLHWTPASSLWGGYCSTAPRLAARRRSKRVRAPQKRAGDDARIAGTLTIENIFPGCVERAEV